MRECAMKAKWTRLSRRLRETKALLCDINHQPLSPDICLYIFKFSGRKQVLRVYLLRQHTATQAAFKPELKPPVITNATSGCMYSLGEMIIWIPAL